MNHKNIHIRIIHMSRSYEAAPRGWNDTPDVIEASENAPKRDRHAHRRAVAASPSTTAATAAPPPTSATAPPPCTTLPIANTTTVSAAPESPAAVDTPDIALIRARLTNALHALLPASDATPATRRMRDDVTKRLNTLYEKLDANQLPDELRLRVDALAAHIDAARWQEADEEHVLIVTRHTSEASSWMPAVRRLIALGRMPSASH